ncbi:MAG: phospholipase [Rhodobacteraceae bacterium]|nr:phospholipase [Paracoccaceae bacterium]
MSDLEVLLTAEQAYPALERAFLAAESEIWASFRVFDPETKLRSREGMQVGRTWYDLIAETLSRGVKVNIAIADFDPVVRPALHRATWRSVRQLMAAAETVQASENLDVVASMHPARTGLIPRLLFWPVILSRQWRTARKLNSMAAAERETALREMPGLKDRLSVSSEGRVRPKFFPLPCLYPATHHQKLAVIDRRRLYLGGLDLDERRFDTPKHDVAADETWHDVQLLLSGPAVEEAQAHLETFHEVTAGRREPNRQRQLLRTLSRPRDRNLLHFGPETVCDEIIVAHEHYARRAQRLIYLETQYFRDLRLARYLASLARANPALTMIVVLPGAPEEIAFEPRIDLDARFGEFLQARALRILVKAFGRRLFVAAMAQPRSAGAADSNGRARLLGAPIVYIHSKVSIFDGTAAIVSSANLNGRSLHWDTEAGLLLTQRRHVDRVRRSVMGHWLPEDAEDAYFDPARALSAWRALALRNMRSAPEAREGFVLPYDIKAAEADAIEVPVIPAEMV